MTNASNIAQLKTALATATNQVNSMVAGEVTGVCGVTNPAD